MTKTTQFSTQLFSYENKLLASLSVAEASMFVDRLALGILTPFIILELHLNNFQIGLLASVFSLSYAVSGYVGGLISDRTSQRRVSLMLHVLAFSVLSAITGFSWSFGFLIVVRVLLGIAEGPVLPLLQATMIPVSSPSRRAFNAAFLQNVAPFIAGQFAAPIVLTHLAERFDWRITFFLTAVPGLLILPFLFRLVRDDAAPTQQSTTSFAPATQSLWRNRNLLLCAAMAACTGTWIFMFNTFLPLYLVNIAGYSKVTMGYAASMLGIGGCVASLILPALSDRVGRRPVLFLAFGLGLIAPITVLLASSVPWMLFGGVLLGSCLLGVTPITITLIPSDVVPHNQLAGAIGITSAASAIVGGMIMTAVGGKAADMFGLQVTMFIALGAMACAACIAVFLKLDRPGTL